MVEDAQGDARARPEVDGGGGAVRRHLPQQREGPVEHPAFVIAGDDDGRPPADAGAADDIALRPRRGQAQRLDVRVAGGGEQDRAEAGGQAAAQFGGGGIERGGAAPHRHRIRRDGPGGIAHPQAIAVVGRERVAGGRGRARLREQRSRGSAQQQKQTQPQRLGTHPSLPIGRRLRVDSPGSPSS